MDSHKTSNKQPSLNKREMFSSFPKLVVIPTIFIIGLGFLAAYAWLIPHGQRIDVSTYQMVQLTNNQTYFGKLQNATGEYLVVESPYTAQNVQQPASSKSTVLETQTTLVKLSEQVVGSQDSIAIRSDQVLFWQNLRSDSKVTKAIEAKQ